MNKPKCPEKGEGYQCRREDCIYKGKGSPDHDNHYTGCDYFFLTGKLRSSQPGGEYAASCKLYLTKAPEQPKPKINRAPNLPPWEDLARSMHAAGRTDAAIAEAVGVSAYHIKRWRLKRGLPSNRPVGGSSKYHLPGAFELYKAGKSDGEIAAAMKCSKATVARWRREHDLPTNFEPRGLINGNDWDEAMRLYEAGKPDGQIAQALGVAPVTVQRWRHRNNLPTKYHMKKESADG